MSSGAFGKGHHLHLVDGSAFIFRAYHALPPLTRKSDGLPIGAVSGFCNMLWNQIIKDHGADAPTHAAVVFDKGSHTFRNDLYDLYKANRDAMPEDLRPQIPLTREATRAFNIACLELEGYEADDIIATLARQAREAGGRVTIISSDKDLMQLVGGGVEMFDAMKNTRIDAEGVEEKFGVGPDRVIDVQALAGDSVDNVPGAPGIGIKTAALLINEYGDLDTLLARAEEIKQPKRRQTLIENAEQIRLSRQLVTLDDHVPMEETLDDLEVLEPQAEPLMDFLAKMEFRTLTKRIAEALGVDAPVISDTDPGGADAESVAETAPEFPKIDHDAYEIVRDLDALQPWIDAAHARGVMAIDTETTSLNEMTAELVGLSLSVEPGRACYIPVGHVSGGGDDLFAEGAARAEGQMALDEALDALKPLLEDDAVLKVLQNSKYDVKVLARYGIDVAPIDDTMLMSYAMNAGLHGHGMDALAERYLGHTDPDQGADRVGQGADHLRQGRDRQGRALCRRGCGRHAAPLAPVQAATAPGAGDDGLRDAGTPAGACAGAYGTLGHQGGSRHAIPHVERLCTEDGGAGGGDP
jgi:DNA polymerase-1